MKLLLLIPIILAALLPVRADNPIKPDDPPPRFMLTHNPVRLMNMANILFLYRTDAGNAAGIDLRHIYSGEELTGWGAAATYRLYPFTSDLTGFYIEPFLAAHALSDGTESSMLYSYGLVPGAQALIKETLAIGFGFGFEYFTSDELIKAAQGSGAQGSTTFNPYFRLDLGIAF